MKHLLFVLALVMPFTVMAHPVSMGRMSITNEGTTIKLELKIDDHACDHILNNCSTKEPDKAKEKFLQVLGQSSLTIGGKSCPWESGAKIEKLSRDEFLLTASAKCEMATGELHIELPFLKGMDEEYRLMTKIKINNQERSLSAGKSNPEIRVVLVDH